MSSYDLSQWMSLLARRLTIRRLCREHDAYTNGHVFPVQHVRHPLLILQLILRTFLYPARTCSIQPQKHSHKEVPDLWIHWQLMYRFLKDTICPFKIHFCAFKSNCVALFWLYTTFHCLNLWYTIVFFPRSTFSKHPETMHKHPPVCVPHWDMRLLESVHIWCPWDLRPVYSNISVWHYTTNTV